LAIAPMVDLDFDSARLWIWSMVAVSYVFTLLIEWPFVVICFRKTERWLRRSIWANVIAQSASYLLLFGYYGAVSDMSVFSEVAIVPAAEILLPKGAVLYYIARDDGNVYTLQLPNGEPHKVCDLGSTDAFDRLEFLSPKEQSGRYRLVLCDRPGNNVDLASRADILIPRRRNREEPEQVRPAWLMFGEVPGFANDESGWTFWWWTSSGLVGENARDDRSLHVTLATPFAGWRVTNAAQLPDGKVVFQLGDNQICVLDPDSKRIALLVKGHGPTVVLSEDAGG
jgi:hypothetical protein